MSLAPIVLFVYNRPKHTQRTLEALAANQLAGESTLYIYSDGPKKDASAETLANINLTREIIKSKKWCKEVIVFESPVNRGLANSVINGVTETVNKHGRVIVMEDDLVTHPFFLRYMNEYLDIYENDGKVISIHGYLYPVKKQIKHPFFIKGADCWGWATWKRGWDLFEPNAELLLDKIIKQNLAKEFNFNDTYDYISLLKAQISGSVDSWAIRWHAAAFLLGKLTLYPPLSLVINIGFDGSGTHKDNMDSKLSNTFDFDAFPIERVKAMEDKKSKKQIEIFFRGEKYFFRLMKRRIRSLYDSETPSPKNSRKSAIKKRIKVLAPSALRLLYQSIRSSFNTVTLYRGNYPSWSAAKRVCSGYEDPSILEKTRTAILKVKHGEAAGERDSVLFDRVQYSWPVLAYLLKIAIENDHQLNVIDFGGSLGSSYFQNQGMIPSNVKLTWNVVEQQNYIEVGNKEIADGRLKFFYSVKEARDDNGANVIFMSSVLQYIEQPYQFLDEVVAFGFKYIIIDRTSFIDDADDRITIQTVPDSIYKASYPAWFFNSTKFRNYFAGRYETMLDFDSEIDKGINLDDQTIAGWRGYVLKKIEPVPNP